MESHEQANRYEIERAIRREMKGRLSEITLAFGKDPQDQQYVEVRGRASSLNDGLRVAKIVAQAVGGKIKVKNMMKY